MVHGRTQSATIDFSSISATSNNNLSTTTTTSTTNSPLRHHSSCDTIQQQQNISSSSAAAVVSSVSTVNNNNNNNSGTNGGGGTNGLQISQQLFHVMSHLSDQQLSELRDVFCLFDSSGDGELDPEEFSQLLLALMSKQEPFNEENNNNNNSSSSNNNNNNSSSNNNNNNNNSSSSEHNDDENNSNNSNNNNSDEERKRHARLLSRELVIEADSSGNGLVDFCEFLTLVTRMVTEVSSVKEAFEVLNMNNNSTTTTTTNSTTNRNNNNNNNNTTTATTTSSFTSSSMGSEDTSQILSRTLQSEEQSLLNSDVGRQSISGDDGSSGATVPLSVFKHAMTTMGERFSEEEVDAMWQELGLDPEADLPIDLFIKYCMSN